MDSTNLDQTNRFVLRKQHLKNNSRIDDIVQITRDISGLHATSFTTPYLSLFVRARNFRKEYLDKELYVKKSLGKIRCMRGTIYILTKEMIPIAYSATREFTEKQTKKYVEFRGFTSEKYEELSKLILDILKGKEMTAPEIKKALKTQLNVSPILYLMCDQGLLVRSSPRKYSLFHEYFPDINFTKMNETEARTLLVQKYLSSFGPVTENDIVWWTGLSKTKVQETLNNIQKQIVQIKISNLIGNYIVLHADLPLMEKQLSGKPTVNMLPSLDPYLMGYKGRERYLEHKYYNKVFDRSGNATSTILIDGRIVGVWDLMEALEPMVKLFFLEEVEENLRREIYIEAQRIGKFIADKIVKIKECDFMIPLTRRPAGAVMSPLKGC